MKTAVTFATLALLASVASADPVDGGTAGGLTLGKDGYVGVGAEAGVQRDDQIGAIVDGGLRLGDTPLYVHGRLAHGMSGNTGLGRYDQARLGLEARTCAGILCGFAGVDAGYQHDHVVHDDWCWGGDNGGCGDARMETNAHDFLLVPRAGVELGKMVKWRTTIEMPVTYRLDQHEDTHIGLSLNTGVSYAW